MTALSTYQVVVSNLSRGWTMTSTSEALTGTETDTTSPSVRRLLTAPFKARWAFKDGLIPNPMDPDRVTFNMWARTVADEYLIDLGDVVTVSLYLNDLDARLLYTMTGRTTEASTDLVPTDPWAVRSKVELTGFTADLGSSYTGTRAAGFGDGGWSRWVGYMSQITGHRWYYPSGAAPTYLMDPGPLTDSMAATVARLVNSAAPGGRFMTFVASYNPAPTGSPPAGYVVPPFPAVPTSYSNVAFTFMYASRTEVDAFAPPLQFVTRAAVLTVTNTPGTVSPRRQPALAASWCRIPTTVRRTRDHLNNNTRLKGKKFRSDTTDSARSDTIAEVTNVSDALTRGAVSRDVDSMMMLRSHTATEESGLFAGVVELGAAYLSDASVLSSTRAYESLEVLTHLMPPDEAYAVLPYLAPHPPERPGGDGRALRHVTVYGTSGAIADASLTPGGFITAGEVTIDGGAMTYRLTTTPGRPTYTGTAPTPITVGGLVAKPLSLYTVQQVDATIRVADLDLIGV